MMQKKSLQNDVDLTSKLSDSKGRKKVHLTIGGAGYQRICCKSCGALLYRIKPLKKELSKGLIEIKCRKCGHMNQN